MQRSWRMLAMNASEMRPAARRARLVMLVRLLAAGLAAAPRANALLGGLIGGEGGGCGADDGSLRGGIGGVADGGRPGGGPLVEKETGRGAGMVRKRGIELLLQTHTVAICRESSRERVGE